MGNVDSADKTIDITGNSSNPEVKGDSIVATGNKQEKIGGNVPHNNNTKNFPDYVFVLLVALVTLILAAVAKSKKRN